MKKIMILACLIFGMGSTYAQNAMGEVIGEVQDTKGESLVDAHVYIDDVFGQRYQARTDFDGRFRISAIPVGEYALNIQKYGERLKIIYEQLLEEQIGSSILFAEDESVLSFFFSVGVRPNN